MSNPFHISVRVQPIRTAVNEELFEALNLDCPGLEKVKLAMSEEDILLAKQELAEYFRTRSNVKYFIDPKGALDPKQRDSEYDTRKADKICENTLESCGIDYKFGPEIDWSINPTKLKYSEWTWQLSRHFFWITLGQAYWATGNEKYARAFVNQLRSWIIQNPCPTTSGNDVGSRWRTIETGIRMGSSWPSAYHYFLLSPSFDDASLLLYLKSTYEHANHLSEFPTQGNWLCMEMNGLYHVGTLFPEFKEAKYWRETAAKCLYKEMDTQVYPDGAQRELAPGYHGVSLRNFVGAYRIAKLNGLDLPEDYVKRFERMYETYMNITSPTGEAPAVNDSYWRDARHALSQGLQFFPERKDFQYIATTGREGIKPDFTSIFMPYAGWYSMRSGWDTRALYAFFDVGPFGMAHQHEDKLSFILYAYGNRLITEGGIYAYDESQWRKYILSARAHNVVRIDGLDQHRKGVKRFTAQNTPLENRWTTNPTYDFAEGIYNEGFGLKRQLKITQTRSILFIKPNKQKEVSYWIVIDVMTPSDEKQHVYDTWFHFNTGNAKIIPEWNAAVSTDPKSANMLIAPLSSQKPALEIVTGQEQPEVQGWVPAEGYDMRPVATPIFTQTATGQITQAYIFLPIEREQEHQLQDIQCKDARFTITFKDGSEDQITILPNSNGWIEKLSVLRTNTQKETTGTIRIAGH